MSDPVFAVHLGGDLYMDSNGALRTGPLPHMPSYQVGADLPVDPGQMKEAADKIASMKAAVASDSKLRADLQKSGLDVTVIFDILSVVATTASIVAPVLAVAVVAIQVLKLFGVLKSGPSALETLVNAHIDQLRADFNALDQLSNARGIEGARYDVEDFSGQVHTFVKQLSNLNPSVLELERDWDQLIQLDNLRFPTTRHLLDELTYTGLFNRNEYMYGPWPLLSDVLFTQPGELGAPAAPAHFPDMNVPRFDHRLMVPLATFAAENYLAAIRGILPEYRTTGDFQQRIHTLAVAMTRLAAALRRFGLARTIYKPEHFSWPRCELTRWEVNDDPLHETPEHLLHILPTCSRWTVGAMDVCSHHEKFFATFLDELRTSELSGAPHSTKHGYLDFRWIPPAKLRRADIDPLDGQKYRITNPEECAEAANARSQADYADLLAASGYLHMLHLAALLRQESTEPDRSQTVSPGAPARSRAPEASSQVEVQSEDILLTGVISSPARREPQTCKNSTRIWTQPIKRLRPVEYTVKLRTLRSLRLAGKSRWQPTVYADYFWTQYDMDPGDPDDPDSRGFMRMTVHNAGLELDVQQLMPAADQPGHPTPRDALHAEGVVEMNAHTFDWWIPIRPPFQLAEDLDATAARLRAAGVRKGKPYGGWNTPTSVPEPVSVVTRPETDLFRPGGYNPMTPEGPTESDDPDWSGERRDAREALVRIQYWIDWQEDRLLVTLAHRPSDRNYIVYLVVEEKLWLSGQVLHTAVPLAVNGQFTYVPQAFFDEERAAYARLERTVRRFEREYSKSREIGPADPILGQVRPGDMSSADGLGRILALAERHEPALLRRVVGMGERDR